MALKTPLQRKPAVNAPPVYRPAQAAVAAPPVYRPNVPKQVQQKPAPVGPPVYRPAMAAVAQRKPALPARPGPAVQRRIASLIGAFAFPAPSQPEYSGSRSLAGEAKKPLLSVKTTTPDRSLHVHFEPVKHINDMRPFAKISGWNIKNTRDDVHVLIETRLGVAVDAEDEALFDRIAPDWAKANSYDGGGITWQAPSAGELRAYQAAQAAERLNALRGTYHQSLTGRRAAAERSALARQPVKFTLTGTTVARRRNKETASQHKTRAQGKLPDWMAAWTVRITDEGAVTASFQSNSAEETAALKASIGATVASADFQITAWSTDEGATAARVTQFYQDYLDAVAAGTHDALVQAGGRAEFPAFV